MKSILLLSSLLLLSFNTFAGQDKGNGGDICENKMRNITNDIETWLLKDGFNGIKLPKDISEHIYKDKMLTSLKNALLSCTSEKLFVGSAEKTCKNFEDQNGEERIICNFDRFMKTEEKEKYRLMHHELAGVAGFEANNNQEASNYYISNQVSDFLVYESQRLGIKMPISDKNCWNYRDDSGLKVCMNDKVMAIGSNSGKIVKGPFKVISVGDEGEVVIQYISKNGSGGFTRKAIAELEIVSLENRQFNSEVKIGDKVLRSSDSKIFEVIGLGADGIIGIKLGPDLNQYLSLNEYTILSK